MNLCHKLYYVRSLSNFDRTTALNSGSGSVVGIATGRTGLSGDQIPVEAKFSAPVQTGPGAHPASCTMGPSSFPGGKERPGRDADPLPPSSVVVKKG